MTTGSNRLWAPALAALCVILPFMGTKSRADTSIRASRTYGIGIEVLGRSFAYGLEIDSVVDADWLAGIGIARIAAQDAVRTTRGSTGLLPIHFARYFSKKDSAFFASAGVTWVLDATRVEGYETILGEFEFSGSPWIPNLGIGYEIRQDNGFLFRVQLLAMRGVRGSITGGLLLGYAFY